MSLKWSHHIRIYLILFFVPDLALASFIESTIGTAVVNDATATYHNPAALMLLKNSQVITLGSLAYFHTHFSGRAIQQESGFVLNGTSDSYTHFFLPSYYVALPIKNKYTIGLGLIINDFYKNSEENSVLRYVQSNNKIENVDFIPALGVKINDYISVGAGLNITHANILTQPATGFPSLNIPDSESRNESSATSWGGHAGFLLKPQNGTIIGFNYRSAITYKFSGKSILEINPKLVSNNYQFKFWTPARSVFSINQFITPKIGLIATIQYIEWHIIKNVNLFNVATRVKGQPTIIKHAIILNHLNNAWYLTLGGQYKFTSSWIIRIAGSYAQSASNPRYQISNGDSFILGASTGFDINKYASIDGSYSHAFIKDQHINIITSQNIINGKNEAYRDAISFKLTLNAF